MNASHDVIRIKRAPRRTFTLNSAPRRTSFSNWQNKATANRRGHNPMEGRSFRRYTYGFDCNPNSQETLQCPA